MNEHPIILRLRIRALRMDTRPSISPVLASRLVTWSPLVPTGVYCGGMAEEYVLSWPIAKYGEEELVSSNWIKGMGVDAGLIAPSYVCSSDACCLRSRRLLLANYGTNVLGC